MTASLVQLGTETPATETRTSPDWVRISYASALALRFKSGRFTRPFPFGGINLLLNYDEGCRSDCGYCGLARSRSGAYEYKSFIRVDWPLVATDELVDRLARYQDRLTRLCISMVTHGHAYRDTLEISRRIRRRVKTPLSILVAPPTLNEDGSAYTDPAGYKIYYGNNPGGPYPEMVDIPDPAVTSTEITVAAGEWFFVATAYNQSDVESVYSGEATKTVTDAPLPPTNLTVADETVYGISQSNDIVRLFPIGTVPVGTACDGAMSVNGRYRVPRAEVDFAGTVQPPVVFAECSPN